MLKEYKARRVFHQKACAHVDNPLGRSADDSIRDARGHDSQHVFGSSAQSDQDAGNVENACNLVGQCCGLAGVFPATHSRNTCCHAKFSNDEVDIFYGRDELQLDGDVYEADNSFPHVLLKQLNTSALSIKSAFGVLQNLGLCCDRVTFLEENRYGNIVMRSIPLGDIFDFFEFPGAIRQPRLSYQT